MKKFFIILLILCLPTFSLMFRSGIYTMHDFHVFRLFEFGKCVSRMQFPCRWADDAGLGYGEPVFNFYGQFPYWIGQIFVSIGFQVIDATKINFALTLIFSGLAMFLLAKKYWGSWGGLLSSVFYIYAPYRAVDVWVRGALNESYAFIFYPLILLSLDNYLDNHKNHNLFILILASAGLVITHNLSALMFAPFLIIWTIFRLKNKLDFRQILNLVGVGCVVFLLSAFYLLPVIFESHLVSLNQTTQDYYNYRLHYTTLYQLFVSNFWGYGGSVWGPNDTLSFSVGYLQWIIPIIMLFFFVFKYLTSSPSPKLGEGNERGEVIRKIFLFTILGFFAIFLTHGKSEIIWKLLPPLSYIQFPWRFLSLSTFFLSLASGAIVLIFSRRFIPLVIFFLILLNVGFFHPDIWRSISDKEQFSGSLWDEQRSSALSDFWPKSASQLPHNFAPKEPVVVLTTNDYQKVQYPVVYFPGWKSTVDIFPSGPLGLITARVPLNSPIPTLHFTDTPVRSLGNWVSIITLGCLLIWRFRYVKN